MIIVNVEIIEETRFGNYYHATVIDGGAHYSVRSSIMESAVRDVVTQIAHRVEDQELFIAYPTVVVRWHSLWAFAGIKTKDEQRRFCPACHAPVTGSKSYCNNTCRQRASRARTRKESA
jgi:hypothetical protein